MMIFILAVTAGYAQGRSGYGVQDTISVGRDGGWDYCLVHPEARRLYVSHGSRVVVVDVGTKVVVGEIPNTPGVHGIAVVPDADLGFISNGRGNSVTLFALSTLTRMKDVPVGTNPDAIIYDPFSGYVLTFNGRSHDASVLSSRTGDSVATIALGGKPEFPQTDLTGRIYVNMEDKSEIAVIDTKTLTVTARWPIAPGESPSGLAIDRVHHRLFSVCDNNLMVVVNTETGRVVTTVPIGSGVDGCTYDADRGLIFSSNGEGTMTVVRQNGADDYAAIETVVTQRGARTITLDPATHLLYLPTAEFGEPPPPSADQPRPRPPMVPESFHVLVVGR